MDWTFFSLLLIASFFLIVGTFSHAWIVLIKYLVSILKKKKKRREKRLKPSNTWLVLAFVCFRVWERSKGDIDERKIATIVSQSMKQRNYPHQVPCILTWGTGMATWSFGWSGITRGIGSLWRIWSFFFQLVLISIFSPVFRLLEQGIYIVIFGNLSLKLPLL